MSSYLLMFTVKNGCNCLGCRGTPWERARECLTAVLPWPQPCKGPGEGIPEAAFGIPDPVKTCVSRGPSLIFPWPSCPIFISGMKGLPAVRRVTVGGSVASCFPSLCLWFLRRASCVTDKKFTVCLLFSGLISMEGSC